MSVEDEEKEYELKDLIVQTLEANGILPKIKVNFFLTKTEKINKIVTFLLFINSRLK